MPTEILQPLVEEDVDKLLVKLKSDLPKTAWIYNWIVSQRAWTRQQMSVRLLVLCPHGDWDCGTLIALNIGLAENGKVFGALYSAQRDGFLLKHSLLQSDMIPWRAVSDYMTVSEKHAGVYLKALRRKGLSVKHQVACAVAYMAPEKAALVEIPELPEQVRIGTLSVQQHLDVVWDSWPHYHPDFKPVVRKMMQANPCFGIFVQDESCLWFEEMLAALVVQCDSIGLGILYTLPAHRGKGYAHALLCQVTRTMGASGRGPLSHVIATDTATMALLKKVGYEFIEQSRWISIAD